jgi:hypothetical protein
VASALGTDNLLSIDWPLLVLHIYDNLFSWRNTDNQHSSPSPPPHLLLWSRKQQPEINKQIWGFVQSGNTFSCVQQTRNKGCHNTGNIFFSKMIFRTDRGDCASSVVFTQLWAHKPIEWARCCDARNQKTSDTWSEVFTADNIHVVAL